MDKTLMRWVLPALAFLLFFWNPGRPAPAGAAEETGREVILEADSVVYDQQAGTARALGNAHVRRGLLVLTADSILLDEEMTRVRAVSESERGVRVRYGDRILEGNDLEYRLDEEVGILRKARGEADAVRFEGDSVEFASVAAARAKGWLKKKQSQGAASDDLFVLGSGMSLTTCREEEPAYRLVTRRLLILPGRRVIAVKPKIYIEDHLLAAYPFDYRIDLAKGRAKPLAPSLFHDSDRGTGAAFRYGFEWGERLAGDLDLALSTNQGLEGATRLAVGLFENGEAFLESSYQYNADEGEKRWRPAWGLRSAGDGEGRFSWSLRWSERESVNYSQGVGRTYKGVLWRDPELSVTSPWWSVAGNGKSQFRFFGSWGRYEESGERFEREGLGVEVKGSSGTRETVEPFWNGRLARYGYDTADARTVVEGSLGFRWIRRDVFFETRYDRRWIDGTTPMRWDDLDEIEQLFQTVDWPLSHRWRMAVRAGYDLQGDRVHEMAYRLAYDRECYRLELFFVDDRVGDDDEIGLRLRIKAFSDTPLLSLDPGAEGFFSSWEENR